MVTVRELVRELKKFPGNTLVAVVHPEQRHWRGEGTIDGPYVRAVYGHEVRSGWHVLHASETDPDAEVKIVLLSDIEGSSGNVLDWQDDVFGGPSPFAIRQRRESDDGE
jgi:hypothetical protein